MEAGHSSKGAADVQLNALHQSIWPEKAPLLSAPECWSSLRDNFHPTLLAQAELMVTLKCGSSASVNLYMLHCWASHAEVSGCCWA